MTAPPEDHAAPEGDGSDDRLLVARFLGRRDEAAFRELFRRHAGAMLALARRMLGDAAAAEDCLQEAWLRASQRLHAFAWRSSLRTWLQGVVVRCCHEALRRRPPERPSEPAAEPAVGPRPLQLDLERALAALPSGYRSVLLLHDLEGWTHQEIGACLGIEVGTSKSQLARARAALRAHWQAAPPPSPAPLESSR